MNYTPSADDVTSSEDSIDNKVIVGVCCGVVVVALILIFSIVLTKRKKRKQFTQPANADNDQESSDICRERNVYVKGRQVEQEQVCLMK